MKGICDDGRKTLIPLLIGWFGRMIANRIILYIITDIVIDIIIIVIVLIRFAFLFILGTFRIGLTVIIWFLQGRVCL